MRRLRYTMTLENLHIYGSCDVPKVQFDRQLYNIRDLYPSCHVWQRPIRSLCLEWATHNALFAMGIKKGRTRDVDLNYPIKWWVELAYKIAGTIVWPFIK